MVLTLRKCHFTFAVGSSTEFGLAIEIAVRSAVYD